MLDLNLPSKTINYYVNGKFVAKDQNEILGDSKRTFMPFVQMWNTDDCVERIID